MHSLTHILNAILNLPHPRASLNNILIFMWCIWKSRNDCHFNRKKGEPYQININAQALCKNMELLDPTENDLQIHQKPVMPRLRQEQHQQGQTIPLDQDILGAKIFSDAS
jgi:hypothetical protein